MSAEKKSKERTSDGPWVKFWPDKLPQQVEYPKVPLYELLKKTAKKYPKKTAILYFDREITYKELNLASDKFATALVALGVIKGDKVAIFLPNIPQFVIVYYGAIKIGAVLTAISPLYKERELEYQLNDSEAETIIALDLLYPIVRKIWEKTKLKRAIITSQDEYLSKTPTLASTAAENETSVHFFQDLLTEHEANPHRVTINPRKDLAILQYTGGTTGTAKGAMLTHRNLVSNAVVFAKWIMGEEAEETFLTVLPLFHIYGMTTSMNVPVYLGGKMIMLPRFDPKTVLEGIQKHKVTVFCGVPTMYAMLVSNPELGKYNLKSIRVCISGASPLPPQIQKKFMEVTGGALVEGYGLTEASPVTHCNPPDKTMKTVKVGSIGLPLPNTDAKIFDIETGKTELKPGETGELAVKGPQIMEGYWKKPEETANVLQNGWLYTGDIGKMDEDRYFYITDRKKDLIKYKDYSVYPREIEDVLYEHPAVKLCAVIGKPDPIVGQIPKAFVVLKERTNATEAGIIEFVKEKVAPYKAIREVEFRKELPTSSVGKVLRRVLQEEERKTL